MANRRKLVIGAAIAGAAALVILASILAAREKNTFYVYFKDISGLQPGATVVAYEAAVGNVVRIRTVDGQHRYKVTLELDRDVRLYPNADIRIAPAASGEATVNIASIGKTDKKPLKRRSKIFVGSAADSKTTSTASRLNTLWSV